MKSQIKFNILTTIVFAALAFAAVPQARAAGKLLSHLSFNDKANPLKVEGGADAVVRRNRNEKVSDMGEVKWEANGGDGAVAIPIGWHIAVPIPEELTKEPGHPFSVEMKVRFSKFQANTYPSLLNMPADNASPGMLYLVTDSQYVDPVICVKQWDKSWGAGEKGKSGFTAEKWETVLAVFDREKTEVFLNGDKIISCKGKLAGSYADCSKAGGYILLSADPFPSGGTIHWADLKIYAGAIGGTSAMPGAGTDGTGGSTSTQGGGYSSQGGGASGNWLCHISFDDHTNPLKANVGADAIVRTGRATSVSGLGDARWEAYGSDGALRVPSGTHIAVPMPPSLAKPPGHPYSVEMKVRFPEPRSKWCCLMNMPAENYSDALAFLTTDADKRVVLKASGRIEGAGTFRLGEWNTFHFQFGEKTTRVFVDGREVFRQDFTLAGSRADCSKADGYFLFAADNDGEDNQASIADLKIYDGAVDPRDESSVGTKTPAGSAEDKNGAKAPQSSTAKDGGGIGCFYPGSGHGGVMRQEPEVKMPDTKRAPDYLNPDGTPVGSEQKPSAEVQQTLTMFSEDDGLSAAEKIPALKAYIETHLNEPGIAKLIDLLEKLAKEANDEETLKWVEEIRKKLADASEAKDGKGNKDATDVIAKNEDAGTGKKEDGGEKKDKADEEKIEDEGATSDELDEPDEPIEIMSDPAREEKLRERRKDPARAAAAAKFLLDL